MAHYRLLALDIDGTLVGPDSLVPAEVVFALAEARAAGVGICLATGRSFVESVGTWRQLALAAPFQPMILVGGALVSEPDTGRSLYQKMIPWAVACEFAEAMNDMGHVAMVLVDAWRWGLDYLVTEAGDHQAATRDWFSKMNVRVRRVGRLAGLADSADRPDALRISIVVAPTDAPAAAEALRARFAGRLNIRAILAPNYGVWIVEAHAAGADKLTALKYVAQAVRLGPGHLAAVGDDINDLPMLQGVGLGVAMAQAPQVLRNIARHTAADGLAAFIRQLAAGHFDPKHL